MCGVFGFAGKPDKETAKIFRYLGFLNEQRGRHSTGFCGYTEDDISVIKDAKKATEFLSTFKNTKEILRYSKMPFCILIGHTRQATVGAISQNNAHPFRIGKIIMTHNGHINNFQELQSLDKTGFEVDSQIIGHLISTKGEKHAFDTIRGWFTVPFIDINNPNILNVAVSEGAVFNYATRGDQVYYSSSETHLKDALTGQEGFQFHSGERNTLYRFYLVNKYMVTSTEQLTTPQPRTLIEDVACAIKTL